MQDRNRTNNFDFLRLAMAVLVIFSHSFPLATGRQVFNVPDHVSLGKLAVAVFFASGYLIAMSWDRSGGLIDFMWRRVLRIYPGFIVAFILSTWLIAPLVSLEPASYFMAQEGASSRAGWVAAPSGEGDYRVYGQSVSTDGQRLALDDLVRVLVLPGDRDVGDSWAAAATVDRAGRVRPRVGDGPCIDADGFAGAASDDQHCFRVDCRMATVPDLVPRWHDVVRFSRHDQV
jgi:hypothetical protein